MATIQERLAQSLEALKEIQDKSGNWQPEHNSYDKEQIFKLSRRKLLYV